MAGNRARWRNYANNVPHANGNQPRKETLDRASQRGKGEAPTEEELAVSLRARQRLLTVASSRYHNTVYNTVVEYCTMSVAFKV